MDAFMRKTHSSYRLMLVHDRAQQLVTKSNMAVDHLRIEALLCTACTFRH